MMLMKNFYKENTVVLIQYPFTDLSSSKVRPALVIRDQIDEDIICLPVSSSFGTHSFDISIPEDITKGFKFPIPSYIRFRKISTLKSVLVRKVLGSLENNFYEQVKKALIEFLKG